MLSARAQTFDYIVVGAGTAGCVLAARLSECGSHRVLLLEAGGEARNPWIAIPAGYARLLANARYNWLYRTQPEPALGGRVLDVPCGRTVGGTGSVNGMIYVRGNAADYDGWRDAGISGWSYDDVLPWFRHSETCARGEERFHGRSGPLIVIDPPQPHPLASAFVDAAVDAGLPRNRDFNGATQEGAGFYQLNLRDGRRASTATAYLQPARRRVNLTVATGALAVRVIFERERASGVEYLHAGRLLRVRAEREVVLCGGTFNTPALLLRSGIGPASDLERLGIAVQAHACGVGANLHNHYRASVVMRCREPITLNDVMGRATTRLRSGLEYFVHRRGPLATGGTEAGAFVTASSTATRPDIQVTFWPYSVAKRGAHGVLLHPFSAFTANVVLLLPQSRGAVRLASADPAAAPAITFNFLTADADRRALVAGIRRTRELLRGRALARVSDGELAPGASAANDDALLQYGLSAGNSVYHPVGTCRMGTDAQAVVDPQLRVRGVDALRVADASVMPTITAGNTNAPTIMIAERAARWMLDDAGTRVAHPA